MSSSSSCEHTSKGRLVQLDKFGSDHVLDKGSHVRIALPIPFRGQFCTVDRPYTVRSHQTPSAKDCGQAPYTVSQPFSVTSAKMLEQVSQRVPITPGRQLHWPELSHSLLVEPRG